VQRYGIELYDGVLIGLWIFCSGMGKVVEYQHFIYVLS